MEKRKVVLNKEGKILLLTNPEEKDYVQFEHIVDPNLELVRGLPPHLWKLEQGHVIPAVEHKAMPYDPEPPIKSVVIEKKREIVVEKHMLEKHYVELKTEKKHLLLLFILNCIVSLILLKVLK